MDRDDLRLIRALQLAPRASFARLGEVLGMHERTVSRRYNALRRQGIVRIFGVVNPLAVGLQLWNVRVRCRPDASESLAQALSSRPDVAWVGVDLAGAEVAFAVRTLSEESRDLLVTRTLPRSAHVLDVEASVVLHVFLGLGAHDWAGLREVLSAAETEEVVACRPAESGGQVTLEPHDSAILDVLAADGRATTAEMAEASGLSEGRAARRLATLLRTRTVVIDLDLAATEFGFHTRARLHLVVAPSRLHQVGEALAAFPEIGFVAATSGRDNLMASVVCRDLDHLYDLTTARIGSIEGIASMEIVLRRIVKQSGGLIADGRLVAPS